jgi:hypothetical protein
MSVELGTSCFFPCPCPPPPSAPSLTLGLHLQPAMQSGVASRSGLPSPSRFELRARACIMHHHAAGGRSYLPELKGRPTSLFCELFPPVLLYPEGVARAVISETSGSRGSSRGLGVAPSHSRMSAPSISSHKPHLVFFPCDLLHSHLSHTPRTHHRRSCPPSSTNRARIVRSTHSSGRR